MMNTYGSSVFSFYIGTNAPGDCPNIYKCEADFERGTFSTIYTMTGPAKPSYLAGPAGNILYTLGRTRGNTGAVYAFREAEAGAGASGVENRAGIDECSPLNPLGFFPCGGDNPCHISLDPQREFLLCANYGSGSISLYDLHADGSIRSLCDCRQYEGTGFDAADRQKGPHAHFAAFGPERDEVLVCDLGLDMVYVYALDRRAGKLRETGRSIRLPDGAGPRHLTFSPQHPGLLYVITEMANTIFSFRYDPETDRYMQFQTVSAVPAPEADWGASSAATAPNPAGSGITPPRPDLMVPSTADNGSIGCAIRFSDDGNYLFVSSRLGYQSISAFRCEADGRLTFCSRCLCGGITPRDFNLFSPIRTGGPDPAAARPAYDYLLVANQDSGLVTALRFDRGGELLSLLDMRMPVDHPTCILPLPQTVPASENPVSGNTVFDSPAVDNSVSESTVSDNSISENAVANPASASDIYGGERQNMEYVLQTLLERIEDLRLRFRSSDSDPVEHCLGRIKSDESMREKCRRNDLPETKESALEQLHDAIGIRIVCAFLNDVYMMRDFIVGLDDVELVREKDYIRHAKPNGYRSLHLILRVRAGADAPQTSGSPAYYVEVQLRTISMDTWAALEHHMKYKKQLSGNTGLLESELKRCADELASTDVSMQTLRDMIRGS